jgi:hypothetical protein
MFSNQLMSAMDASVNQTSAPLAKEDLTDFFVQFSFSSGTINGTGYIEASADNITYVPVSGTSQASIAGSPIQLNCTHQNYRYVRAQWVATSGAGTVTCVLNGVEPVKN